MLKHLSDTSLAGEGGGTGGKVLAVSTKVTFMHRCIILFLLDKSKIATAVWCF